MVDLNITVAIQIVNFILALIILNFVLIRPIRGILKQRRDIVNGLVNEAERQNSEADMRLQKYEAELDAARTAANEQREVIRQQGIESEHSITADAQSDALAFLQKSHKEVELEVADVMKSLRAQVDAMAGKVVAKVLE